MARAKKSAMTIKNKLLTTIISMGILIVLSVAFSVYQQHYIGDRYNAVIEDDVKACVDGYAAGRFFNAAHCEMLRALLQTDIDARNKCLAKMEYFDGKTDEHMKAMTAKAKSEAAMAAVKVIQNDVDQYRKIRKVAIVPMKDGNVNMKALGEAELHVIAFRDHCGEVFKKAEASEAQELGDLNSRNNTTATLMSVVAAIAVACALFVGIRLANGIVERINNFKEGAIRIAGGDLSVPFDDNGGDELSAASDAFEKMRTNVKATISEIRTAADQVATGAKNISDASISLSQGATEQAASIEELSTSISEISAQTTSNAEAADRASGLSLKAKAAADEGDQSMHQMLDAMEAINESSTSISKIIKVIDEIAFQTNILALNAAVEAARAGQHGKGFAVVAEEVRNLAARSAKAAKETTDMIEDSITRVAEGRNIAQKTAESLVAIVDNVTETANIVDSIATASNEQRSAIEQVNEGVLQVSKVVEANSASSEESAAASEELSREAFTLNKLAARFKLGAGDGQDTFNDAQADMPAKIVLTDDERL